MWCCCPIWARPPSRAASTWARRSSSTSRPSWTAIPRRTGSSWTGARPRSTPRTDRATSVPPDVPAGGTIRVAAQPHEARARRQGVEQQQLARKTVAEPDDLLHHLDRLPCAHDAGDGAQYPRFGAVGDALRRLRHEAAIAGKIRPRIWLECGELPLELAEGRGHQGLAQAHAGV